MHSALPSCSFIADKKSNVAKLTELQISYLLLHRFRSCYYIALNICHIETCYKRIHGDGVQVVHSGLFKYFSEVFTCSHVKCMLEGACVIGNEISHWLFIAEARVRSYVYLSGICGWQCGIGTGLFLSFGFSPVSSNSTNAPRSLFRCRRD